MLRNNILLFLLIFLLFGCTALAAEMQPPMQIDVLIAFDRNAAAKIRASHHEWAQTAVNNLQQAMVRSELGDRIHFNLVGVEILNNYASAAFLYQEQLLAVAAQDPSITQAQLKEALTKAQHIGAQEDYLNIINNRIPELTEARNRCHADIVFLARDYYFMGLYGIGYGYSLGDECQWIASGKRERINEPFFSEKNFVGGFHFLSMLTPQDGVDVFVHETMHLLGCGHSDRQVSGAGPFYYTDSSGFYTDDFRYGTVMGYPWRSSHVPHDSVPHVDGDTRSINCLSGPYSPRLSGEDATLRNLPREFGDIAHNNRLTALHNAALVSAYRLNGSERVFNDTPSQALPLPPLQTTATWLRNMSQMQTCVELLENSIPGIRRENAMTTVVFGCNFAARPDNRQALPGGSGKVVWYRVTAPADGELRVGIRQDGTWADLQPVVSLFHPDRTPCTDQRDVPQNESSGYYTAVQTNAQAGQEFLFAVDSGNARGGQFSLVAQLKPEGRAANVPIPETPGVSAEPASAPLPSSDRGRNDMPVYPPSRAEHNSWGGVDTLLLLITLLSSGSTIVLFLKNRRNNAGRPPVERKPSAPKQPLHTQQPPHLPAATLTDCLVLNGTLYSGLHEEYTFPLARLKNEHRVLLGYNDDCGIRIEDDTISGRHAVIELVADPSHPGKADLMLRDVGSTNGTYIGGRRLSPGERAKIHHEESFRLGMATFTLHLR